MRTSNYGFKEKTENVFFLLRSKILVPNSRLIRFPIVIRGKKWIDFGDNITTGRRCRLEVNGIHENHVIKFGKNVNMGDDVRISAAQNITIGNDVLIGSKVLVIDNSHGSYSGEHQDSPDIPPDRRELCSAPVVIENNVWIGEGSVIQMGVTVGYGSIIGANSVVTKDIPPLTIACGVPARVIKRYNGISGCWERVSE